jgi:hypothetical protein
MKLGLHQVSVCSPMDGSPAAPIQHAIAQSTSRLISTATWRKSSKNKLTTFLITSPTKTNSKFLRSSSLLHRIIVGKGSTANSRPKLCNTAKRFRNIMGLSALMKCSLSPFLSSANSQATNTLHRSLTTEQLPSRKPPQHLHR